MILDRGYREFMGEEDDFFQPRDLSFLNPQAQQPAERQPPAPVGMAVPGNVAAQQTPAPAPSIYSPNPQSSFVAVGPRAQKFTSQEIAAFMTPGGRFEQTFKDLGWTGGDPTIYEEQPVEVGESGRTEMARVPVGITPEFQKFLQEKNVSMAMDPLKFGGRSTVMVGGVPVAQYADKQSWYEKVLDPVAQAAPALVLGVAAPYLAAGLGGGLLGAAGAGAITGGVGAGMSGQDPLKGALKGAFAGGIGSLASPYINKLGDVTSDFARSGFTTEAAKNLAGDLTRDVVTGAARSGLGAGLSGQSVIEGIKSGAISGALNTAGYELSDKFGDIAKDISLPDPVKNVASAALTAAITGGDVDKAVKNAVLKEARGAMFATAPTGKEPKITAPVVGAGASSTPSTGEDVETLPGEDFAAERPLTESEIEEMLYALEPGGGQAPMTQEELEQYLGIGPERVEVTGRRLQDLSFLPEDFGGFDTTLPKDIEDLILNAPTDQPADQQVEVIGKRLQDLEFVPSDLPALDVDTTLPKEIEDLILNAPADQQVEVIGKRSDVQPIELDIPFEEPGPLVGLPDAPSDLEDLLLPPDQRVEVIGKKPSVSPIDLGLTFEEPGPLITPPDKLQEDLEKLITTPPAVTPAPAPSPRAPAPSPRPSPTPPPPRAGRPDLSGLFALLGMLSGKGGGGPEALQLANVAPGVEAGLRAIEEMYGSRRG